VPRRYVAVAALPFPERVGAHAKRAPKARPLRTVVAAVLLVAVLAAVGVASLALVRGTWMVTPFLSGSMRPGLAVGGVAISERVPVHSLAVREVIVFQRPDKPSEQVVHRTVQLAVGSSGQVQINTQGDANIVRDPWTLTIRGDTAYRVRWSVPLIGYVAVAFQNHRGFALLGAGIVLIVIALTMVSGSRRRGGRGDEEDGASESRDNLRPGAEQADDVDTPGDTDALSGIGAVDDWPLPRHGDAERPPPVPSLVPSVGQDGTQ
jgi:signal peptidase I